MFCSLPFDELSPFDHVVTVSLDHVKNVVFCEQAEPSKQSVLLSFICMYIYNYIYICIYNVFMLVFTVYLYIFISYVYCICIMMFVYVYV